MKQINVMKEAHVHAKKLMEWSNNRWPSVKGYAKEYAYRYGVYNALIPTSYKEALSIGLKIAHKQAKAQRKAEALKVTPKFSIMQKITNFVTKTVADVKNTILASFLVHQNTREA